jgi:Protein of unknown function (DUF3761)
MLRAFTIKYSGAIKVGILVAIFPLIYALGVALSPRSDNPPLQSPTDSIGIESNTLVDTDEASSNYPNVDDMPAVKNAAKHTPPQMRAAAVRSDTIDKQVTPAASNDLTAQAAPVASGVTPQSNMRCPHGTYIDASDNELCRPSEDFPVPEGALAATAKCADGSYSFSLSTDVACADHGGIASLLKFTQNLL